MRFLTDVRNDTGRRAVKQRNELTYALWTVLAAGLHGGLHGLANRGTDIAGKRRKTLIVNVAGLGRGLASEKTVEGGTKRIDIGGRREGAYAAALVLLKRSVAVTDADGGAAGLLTAHVVLLGEAEVDEDGLVVAVEENIAGLHIEVHHTLAMHIVQRRSYLTDVAYGSLLGKGTALGLLTQRAAADILHDIVRGVVLLEHVDDAHYVFVAEAGDGTRLLDEFLAETVDHIAAAH